MGYSPALFFQIWICWCLRDHIHGNIGNGACGTLIFFFFDIAESAKESTGGLYVLLLGGTWPDRSAGAFVGAVTSLTAMA